jgi:hypothetical protein
VQVPEITLHASPSRLTQLLQVINTIMPPAELQLDPAPWIRSAEYTSTVDALSWNFVTGASQWQPRFAVVYRGTLYLMESDASPAITRQVALWQGRRIVPLPAHLAGEQEHVLAVAPAHVPRERMLEEPAAFVLRLQSDYMLQEWTRRLRHSAAQMRSVANWHRTDEVRNPRVPSLVIMVVI